MNMSFLRKLLAAAVAGMLVTGCGGSGPVPNKVAPTAALSAFLPEPSVGWKLAERHADEKVGDAGLHCWAVYVPDGSDAMKIVDRVEVNFSIVRSGETKEATSNLTTSTENVHNFAFQTPRDEMLRLRRLPDGGQFMEAIEIGGQRAAASAPMYKEQIISLTLATNRHVDVVVYRSERAHSDGGRRGLNSGVTSAGV